MNDWFAQTFGLGSIHSQMIGLHPNDRFAQTYGLGSIDYRMIWFGQHSFSDHLVCPNLWFGQHSFQTGGPPHWSEAHGITLRKTEFMVIPCFQSPFMRSNVILVRRALTYIGIRKQSFSWSPKANCLFKSIRSISPLRQAKRYTLTAATFMLRLREVKLTTGTILRNRVGS